MTHCNLEKSAQIVIGVKTNTLTWYPEKYPYKY